MKINLSAEIIEDLYKKHCFNNIANELLSNYFLTQNDNENSYAKQCSKLKPSLYKSYVINNILKDATDYSLSNEDIDQLKNKYLESFEVLANKTYEQDPYFLNIKPKPNKYKDFILDYNYFQKGEILNVDELSFKQDNISEINKIGYFSNTFNYLVLLENDEVWMSITPFEINTMRNSIENAYGNVLVCGLGLGYYPYMISFNSNVKNIYIVEFEKQIIDIFSYSIYPLINKQFEIIKGDCFELFDKLIKEKNINYVFFDIYHDEHDGLESYLLGKKIRKKYPEVHFEFWIEKSMKAYIKKILITVIYETYINYISDENEDNIETVLLSKIKEIYKDLTIDSKEKLYSLFSEDNIDKLIDLIVSSI